MKIYIVLGNKLNKDNTISNKLKSRLDYLVANYDKKSYIVLSGGLTGGNKSEATAMKEYLLKKKFPESKMVLETKSKNTWENIINSFELLENRFREKNYKFHFISNEEHLNKVTKILKKLNLL